MSRKLLFILISIWWSSEFTYSQEFAFFSKSNSAFELGNFKEAYHHMDRFLILAHRKQYDSATINDAIRKRKVALELMNAHERFNQCLYDTALQVFMKHSNEHPVVGRYVMMISVHLELASQLKQHNYTEAWNSWLLLESISLPLSICAPQYQKQIKNGLLYQEYMASAKIKLAEGQITQAAEELDMVPIGFPGREFLHNQIRDYIALTTLVAEEQYLRAKQKLDDHPELREVQSVIHLRKKIIQKLQILQEEEYQQIVLRYLNQKSVSMTNLKHWKEELNNLNSWGISNNQIDRSITDLNHLIFAQHCFEKHDSSDCMADARSCYDTLLLVEKKNQFYYELKIKLESRLQKQLDYQKMLDALVEAMEKKEIHKAEQLIYVLKTNCVLSGQLSKVLIYEQIIQAVADFHRGDYKKAEVTFSKYRDVYPHSNGYLAWIYILDNEIRDVFKAEVAYDQAMKKPETQQFFHLHRRFKKEFRRKKYGQSFEVEPALYTEYENFRGRESRTFQLGEDVLSLVSYSVGPALHFNSGRRRVNGAIEVLFSQSLYIDSTESTFTPHQELTRVKVPIMLIVHTKGSKTNVQKGLYRGVRASFLTGVQFDYARSSALDYKPTNVSIAMGFGVEVGNNPGYLSITAIGRVSNSSFFEQESDFHRPYNLYMNAALRVTYRFW